MISQWKSHFEKECINLVKDEIYIIFANFFIKKIAFLIKSSCPSPLLASLIMFRSLSNEMNIFIRGFSFES